MLNGFLFADDVGHLRVHVVYIRIVYGWASVAAGATYHLQRIRIARTNRAVRGRLTMGLKL